MLVKFKNVSFIIDETVIAKWAEIQLAISVLIVKQQSQTRNAINNILKHRELYNEYINKTDKELEEILKDIPLINYDRYKMEGLKSPFEILKSTI